ncbi:MAG: hypothetical protein KGM24_11955 [Elusimicrobia bacterium]|nr:hypothetical protein [Elusimicrobiota bacterium]
MTRKVKTAAEWLSEAIETACGWALGATLIYALLFTNLSGNGRLWDAMKGYLQDQEAQATAPRRVVTTIARVVPPATGDELAREQDRMLFVPEAPNKPVVVAALAAHQPRPSAALTDAPADKGASAGSNWEVHLKGSLPAFSIYGDGEQRSSAVARVGSYSAPAAAEAVAAPTPSVAGSAYRSGFAAAARPGIGDHVSNVSGGISDGVRNFK